MLAQEGEHLSVEIRMYGRIPLDQYRTRWKCLFALASMGRTANAERRVGVSGPAPRPQSRQEGGSASTFFLCHRQQPLEEAVGIDFN